MVKVPTPAPLHERPIGTEEALAKAILELMNPKIIDYFSELNDEEILMLSALRSWGRITGIKEIDSFVADFLKLRVSKHRQGRREIPLSIGFASGGAPSPRGLRSLLSSLRI